MGFVGLSIFFERFLFVDIDNFWLSVVLWVVKDLFKYFGFGMNGCFGVNVVVLLIKEL